jgi:hypothetical protein
MAAGSTNAIAISNSWDDVVPGLDEAMAYNPRWSGTIQPFLRR